MPTPSDLTILPYTVLPGSISGLFSGRTFSRRLDRMHFTRRRFSLRRNTPRRLAWSTGGGDGSLGNGLTRPTRPVCVGFGFIRSSQHRFLLRDRGSSGSEASVMRAGAGSVCDPVWHPGAGRVWVSCSRVSRNSRIRAPGLYTNGCIPSWVVYQRRSSASRSCNCSQNLAYWCRISLNMTW